MVVVVVVVVLLQLWLVISHATATMIATAQHNPQESNRVAVSAGGGVVPGFYSTARLPSRSCASHRTHVRRKPREILIFLQLNARFPSHTRRGLAYDVPLVGSSRIGVGEDSQAPPSSRVEFEWWAFVTGQ